jgi:1,4-alpha-glucan branching enzyme
MKLCIIKQQYNMSSKKIDFILHADVADGATSGILLGDFNNWDLNNGVALKQQKDGSFKASLSLKSGSYEYRYLLNDGRWVNDTQASRYSYNPEFSVENCVIEVVSEIATVAQKATTTVKAKATSEPVTEKTKAAAKTTKAKVAIEPKVEAIVTKTTKAKKA